MGIYSRRGIFTAALLAGSALVRPAVAQSVLTTPPPVRSAVDNNSVNVISGEYVFPNESLVIGDVDTGMTERRSGTGSRFSDSISGYWANGASGEVDYVVNGSTHSFILNADGTSSPKTLDGFTLSGAVLVGPDGTKYSFGGPSPIYGQYYSGLTSVEFANKKLYTYHYTSQSADSYTAQRLQSVTSNSGYHAKISYQNETLYGISGVAQWQHPLFVTLVNQIADPCDVTVNVCSAAYGKYPSVNSSQLNEPQGYYIDSEGNTTYFDIDQSRNVTNIRFPQNSNANIVLGYDGTFVDGHSAVTSLAKNTLTNGATQTINSTYSYVDASGIRTTTATTNGTSEVYQIDISKDLILSYKDRSGRLTQYQYNAANLLSSVIYPEQDHLDYAYDGRGNVTSVTRYPKSVVAVPPLVLATATYEATCSNPVTCNKPLTTSDANGSISAYTYDPTHGGVLTITRPAPVAGGVHPQTRYTYAQYDENGNASASGVFVVSSVSECRTLESCAGSADERVTTYSYGRNLQIVSTSVGSGDGQSASVTGYSRDDIGNPVATDGPAAGADDTILTAFSKGRRPTAILAADPDGAGAQRRQATRLTYGPFRNVTKTETGVADALSVTGLNSFTASQTTDSAYDNFGRKITDTVTGTAGVSGVVQYSYDQDGRPQCTAARLDPSQWTSQTDACTPQLTGSAGPDRITRSGYDADGRVTSTVRAVGTDQQAEESFSYTQNGKVASTSDGNSNSTTYGYDGYDRQTTTTYPDSSYTQVTLDSNGNVLTQRVRDGQSIAYTYDALNRRTAVDRPNATPSEPDTSYAFDNFDNLIQASDTSGRVLAFQYDAFSRRVGQTDSATALGNASFLYDSAGRRARLTWADGNFVSYDYLPTNKMSAIRDSNGVALISFGYDDLGRRATLTRANGTVTAYQYNPSGNLSQLTQDLAGTPSDLTVTMQYNPSNQLVSRTSSNDTYAWTGHYNIDRPYTVNGLNQLTAAGTAPLGYDGRGNLTSSSGTTYAYTADNQMIAAGAVALSHDPLGRLTTGIFEAGVTSTMTYDGSDVLAEVDQGTGALLRRYVYGPGIDEPLIWFEGAERRWLHADERGSIIAVSNDAGNAIAINSYDEFGIPGAGNAGRFQFTGQKWLPNIGLYDYKTRIYSPTLGRFMQTDQVGYGAGLNLYNYVGSDPVNNVDPNGQDPADLGTYTGPDIFVQGQRFTNVSPIGTTFLFPGGGVLDSFFSENIQRTLVGQARKPRRSGRRCSQSVLNAAQALSRFADGVNNAGDAFIGAGAVAAVGGGLAGATLVGAPVGAGLELTAGGLATFGLGAKLIGGAGKYLADSVAAIETGNKNSFYAAQGGAAFSLAPASGGVAGDVLQDRVSGAAGSAIGSSESDKTCPS